MRQLVTKFMTHLAASMPKLPDADLKPFDSELKKLRAVDVAEAQRQARIAELEAQKAQAITDQAEAQRLSDVQALLPEYQEACSDWAQTLESLEHDLRLLISNYQRSMPAYLLAKRLAKKLKELGADVSRLEHREPRATPERADHWLRYLLDSGALTTHYRDVAHQLEAEEVGRDD